MHTLLFAFIILLISALFMSIGLFFDKSVPGGGCGSKVVDSRGESMSCGHCKAKRSKGLCSTQADDTLRSAKLADINRHLH